MPRPQPAKRKLPGGLGKISLDHVCTVPYNVCTGGDLVDGSNAKKTERIDLRVSPEEKSMLKELAAAAGLTVTGFLLAAVSGAILGDAFKDITDKIKKP